MKIVFLIFFVAGCDQFEMMTAQPQKVRKSECMAAIERLEYKVNELSDRSRTLKSDLDDIDHRLRDLEYR